MLFFYLLQYRDRPLHIVSESYGGKMAAEIARAIVDAQAQEDLKVNFRYAAIYRVMQSK